MNPRGSRGIASRTPCAAAPSTLRSGVPVAGEPSHAGYHEVAMEVACFFNPESLHGRIDGKKHDNPSDQIVAAERGCRG